MDNPSTFIFIGKSGAGKGTQAELLIKYLKEQSADTPVLYLETGERFREFINGPSYTSARAREIMAEGGLMPAYLAIWNWTSVLIDKLTGREHLIVDGMPRMLVEAMAFNDALEFYNRHHAYFIYLDVDNEEATARLLGRGRADDKEEMIEKRLGWFESQVLPGINFFRDKPSYRFLQINGKGSVEEVHEAIIRAL